MAKTTATPAAPSAPAADPAQGLEAIAAKLDQLREEIQEGLSAARPQPGIERRSSVRGGRSGPAIPAPPKHKCRSSSSVPALSMI